MVTGTLWSIRQLTRRSGLSSEMLRGLWKTSMDLTNAGPLEEEWRDDKHFGGLGKDDPHKP